MIVCSKLNFVNKFPESKPSRYEVSADWMHDNVLPFFIVAGFHIKINKNSINQGSNVRISCGFKVQGSAKLSCLHNQALSSCAYIIHQWQIDHLLASSQPFNELLTASKIEGLIFSNHLWRNNLPLAKFYNCYRSFTSEHLLLSAA